MSVSGLKSLIDNYPEFGIEIAYKLQDTHLIIDAYNVKNSIFDYCHEADRADQFGGDMVRYAETIRVFLDNLKRANVTPIFVFGARRDVATDPRIEEQLDKIKVRLAQIGSFYNGRRIDMTIPCDTLNVFINIIHDYKHQITCTVYEPDLEIAELANHHKCPVLSDHSKFFLLNLKHGLISFENPTFMNPLASGEPKHDDDAKLDCQPIHCKRFTQDKFVQAFPELDKNCLPLLGVMGGKDYLMIPGWMKILRDLPDSTSKSQTIRIFGDKLTKSHDRLRKILYFLCHKSPQEAIDQICEKFKIDRTKIEKLIDKNRASAGAPNTSKLLTAQLRKICSIVMPGSDGGGDHAVDSQKIEQLAQYFQDGVEKHAFHLRDLKILYRTPVFIDPLIEDITRPSTRAALERVYRVVARLFRSHGKEDRVLSVYDRIVATCGKVTINELAELEDFGPIDFLVYDLVTMPSETRLKLLLATFYSNVDKFNTQLGAYKQYFDSDTAHLALYIKLILDYLDKVEPTGKRVSNRFKQAVFTTFIYYYRDKDSTYKRLYSSNSQWFVQSIETTGKLKPARIFKGWQFEFFILHQLASFRRAISGFNMLNSVLGEPLMRFRTDTWLNSCLIYNLNHKNHKFNKAFHQHDKTMIAFE